MGLYAIYFENVHDSSRYNEGMSTAFIGSLPDQKAITFLYWSGPLSEPTITEN
jgi:hypothetical protein